MQGAPCEQGSREPALPLGHPVHLDTRRPSVDIQPDRVTGQIDVGHCAVVPRQDRVPNGIDGKARLKYPRCGVWHKPYGLLVGFIELLKAP
ncbi:hypothetical protein PQR33_45905 [Paraburkholderia sediminicola]|uniref:hypothetical protein n=1 Tax=Paraburkholderia sediminicola TaxID=458836 RepID=UPI0038BA10F8